jgi:glycosyltransferase involved in cell wall biosynthesis
LAGAPATLGSAVFVGTARNCARYLPDALERWSQLATLFSPAHFLVAENDSTDGTKDILAAWAGGGAHRSVLTLDGLATGAQYRSVVLAAARNSLLDAIRARDDLRSADWLVVMDMDNVSLAITPGRLRRAMQLEGWDGLFANQLSVEYYDVWALRDDRRSPDDWLRHVEAAPPGWRRTLARLRHVNWRARPIPPWRKPFPVRSAFGGLAIYRLPLALTSSYAGTEDGHETCEHVPFNQRLVEQGARLFVHPGLINMVPMPVYRLLRMAGMW